MGPAIQAPVDTSLTPLAAKPRSKPVEDASASGDFAAVAQDVRDRQEKPEATGAHGPKATAAAKATKTGKDAHAKKDKPEDAGVTAVVDVLASALAALHALTAPGDNVTQPTGVETPPTDAAAGTPITALGTPQQPEAALPTEADATDATPALDADAVSAPAPAANAAPPTEAEAAAAQPNAAVALSAEAAIAEATKIVSKASGDTKPAAKSGHPPDPAVNPPAESSPGPAGQTQHADSVVRFAGNAQPQHGNDNQGHGKGNTPSDPKQPNASVQGIAHAADGSAVGALRTASTDPAAVTDVPQAQAPAPAAPQLPPAVQHVAQTIIDQAGKGGGQARIHLNPAELGDVTIQVHADGDHIRIQVHADRPEAMNLLRDHTADLSNLLGSRGLNLSDVFVGLGGQHAGGSHAGEQQQHFGARTNNGEFASLMGAGEPLSIDTHNRLRSAYNPDGALSYRI